MLVLTGIDAFLCERRIWSFGRGAVPDRTPDRIIVMDDGSAEPFEPVALPGVAAGPEINLGNLVMRHNWIEIDISYGPGGPPPVLASFSNARVGYVTRAGHTQPWETEMNTSMEFVGTATTVLRLGRFTLLTDPNFLHSGQRVHLGYGLFSKRRTEPAMQPEDLPPLDGVLLSHLHGDHFDRVARARLRRDLSIVTTPHASSRLQRWGFRESIALDTWATHEFTRDDERLRITAIPGTHGPGLVGRLLPPVMGSVVELTQQDRITSRYYITGDTLFRHELHEVVERFPDLDAMIIHLGGTRALGVLVTMDDRQGADMVDLIRSPVTIPIHYDDYTVFRSPLSDFLTEVSRRRLPGELRTIHRGQTIPLPARTYPAQPPADRE